MKILVVEDSPPLAKAAKLKLEKYGFDVDNAMTISQAKKLFAEGRSYNAVWLDHYLMGEENGFALMEYMKEKSINVPVFLISNTATAEKVKKYKAMGIEEYYLKSNNKIDSLVKAIFDKISVAPKKLAK